jgi:hypothetical protein
MMEAGRTSEAVNLYQTARCYNPEDSHLHTHHHENLKSYLSFLHSIKCGEFPDQLSILLASQE